MRMEWLRELLGKVSDANPYEHIRNATRAYLLYLLGCTLFSDKSMTQVPVVCLRLLMDFDEARTHAWGANAFSIFVSTIGICDPGWCPTDGWIFDAIGGLDI